MPKWVGFGLNKWKKLRQIRQEAVGPSSETGRWMDKVKKEKRSGRRRRKRREEEEEERLL